MRVSPIQTNSLMYNNLAQKNISASKQAGGGGGLSESRNYTSAPVGFKYGANIHFGEFFDPNRTVPHIDHEEYMCMQNAAKKRFRLKYKNFAQTMNVEELFDPKDKKMPLLDEKTMDEFIKTSQIYSKYKDQPIICLGRSPKWFLNASLWSEGGINDYKFVAFSGYWHRPDYTEGMIKMERVAPTEKEELAYRRYLKRIKADPQTIVNEMEKTGKKTVITDYICSGKGACSFLDIMGRYAEDLGILEKFSKSIQIVGIGSMDYMEELNPYAESYSQPQVPMPKILQPYYKNIKQEFYNMDYNMFNEMLINQNTNECRSTYYPHTMWSVYQPDRFKTGLIKDTKKLKFMLEEAKGPKKVLSHFTPTMFDFRNLLNFRILDALSTRGLLKAVHKSKI